MKPEKLSRQLREASTPDLNRRRWIIGLSMVGAGMAQIVSLYQVGILKNLPDPPLSIFNSSKVDASSYAYSRLQTPDGFMMLVGYGITAWLAAAGGKNRAHKQPLLPLGMGLKIVMDTAVALELAREEWGENRALCAYCQVATLASLVSIGLALPEVITATQEITSGVWSPHEEDDSDD